MKDVVFVCYNSWSEKDQKDFTLFLFYPDGVWDEDKLMIKDAVKKYPPKKFNWIFAGEPNGHWVTTGTA